MTTFLRQAAGALGSAIDKYTPSWISPSGGTFGVDISSTLQNYGGNVAGSLKDAIVRPAYASEPSGPLMSTQNMSTQPSSPSSTINQPKAPSGNTSGGGGGDLWSQIAPFYSGWDQSQAMADFQQAFGGDLGRLQQSRGGGSVSDPYAALRSEISSGWDNYINTLNQQLEGLSGQKEAQEGIATNQFQQGVNTLGQQKAEGMDMLGTQRERTESNQAKTLRDLEANLRNSFMAGNVFLGARGAGDSSAANQYAYALTKLGSKQRGDVMSQTADIMREIDARETNLARVYDTEVKNLELQKNSRVNEIADWFNQAQNALRQAQAQGQLGKSQDLQNLSRQILDQGISQMNALNQEISNRRSALEQWAMGVSSNISQLRQNMQGISQFAPTNLPQASQIVGQPQIDSAGNFRVPAMGYGSSADEWKKNLLV